MLINKKYISVKVNDEKLKASNKGLAILLEMSNYLAGSLTTKSLFEGALSRVLEHFDLEAGRIYLLNGAGQYLYLVSHQGMEPHGLERVSINEGFRAKQRGPNRSLPNMFLIWRTGKGVSFFQTRVLI